ncbi:MAG: hypothetical protein NkDv07_0602 [Candidatus Improbicoccus devescovinae]|nr:MAG: hypothetical protein NkDv07_0602 [Candidatus Improbicoccus devescovinae]
MNINPIIELVFKDFELDGIQIPVSFLFYTGKSDSYLTYYTYHEEPSLYSCDSNEAEIASVTIDIFSRNNFKILVETVKQKMKNGGFTWQNNASETYEPDTKYFHVPINFTIGIQKPQNN